MSELSDFQKKQLLKNPNVEKVTEDQVLFTPDFKRALVESYLAGTHPEDFFIEADINLDYFPEHFAQSCLKRWLKKYRDLGRDAFKEDGRGRGATGRPKKVETDLSYEDLQALVQIQGEFIAHLKKKKALTKKTK